MTLSHLIDGWAGSLYECHLQKASESFENQGADDDDDESGDEVGRAPRRGMFGMKKMGCPRLLTHLCFFVSLLKLAVLP